MNEKAIKVVKLEQIADVKVGLQTGDNPSYLFQNPESRGTYRSIKDYQDKLLSQDDLEKIRNNEKLRLDVIEKGISTDDKRSRRYFGGRYIIPYDKGGESDTYGGWLPNYYVPPGYYIDWSEWAVNRMKTLSSRERNRLQGNTGGNDRLCSRFQNADTYFKEGITFSWTGVYAPTFRLGFPGPYDHGSSSIFLRGLSIYEVIGNLCSKLNKYLMRNYINHSVNFMIRDVEDIILRVGISQKPLTSQVENLIKMQQKDPRYNYASNEQLEIDRLVYEAYGLNEEDINEVENWYARRYPKLVQSIQEE